MAKYEISKTDILSGTFECITVEIDSYEMDQNILPKYMNDTADLIDFWVYDNKTGKKMLYASTNKNRDMSDITKENPICFGYRTHWWVTLYCEDNQIHCEYHISLMQQMYVAYNNMINEVIAALNKYYPAIKNRYKTFGFTIAEVPVEM